MGRAAEARRRASMISGIVHVQLSITPGGEDVARGFYRDLLQLREIPRPDSLSDRGGCWFACGAQEIHCGVEEAVAPSRRHPALLTDDLDGLKSRLEAAGVSTQVDRQIPGYRRFYALDPFGNRIEFLQAV